MTTILFERYLTPTKRLAVKIVTNQNPKASYKIDVVFEEKAGERKPFMTTSKCSVESLDKAVEFFNTYGNPQE